ncbi:hypothetical protein NDU88_006251 [Pleurodeles waltl]|uniref:Uncharacterized protein n=1 Tax=Pleurodeles waltl TaxID=8319 RepID=A0AAV7TX44_PLEWA|nr:hypothetical protein NDU88_006251 [Pleurodeles waltl]
MPESLLCLLGDALYNLASPSPRRRSRWRLYCLETRLSPRRRVSVLRCQETLEEVTPIFQKACQRAPLPRRRSRLFWNSARQQHNNEDGEEKGYDDKIVPRRLFKDPEGRVPRREEKKKISIKGAIVV